MKQQDSNENIGKRVANLRRQHNLTQAQLAEEIGTSSKHISEIERGVTGISIDIQIQLSEKLRCSLDYLILGDDFKSVDSYLPANIVEIFHSHNQKEISLLLEYLNFYEKLRQTDA